MDETVPHRRDDPTAFPGAAGVADATTDHSEPAPAPRFVPGDRETDLRSLLWKQLRRVLWFFLTIGGLGTGARV